MYIAVASVACIWLLVGTISHGVFFFWKAKNNPAERDTRSDLAILEDILKSVLMGPFAFLRVKKLISEIKKGKAGS